MDLEGFVAGVQSGALEEDGYRFAARPSLFPFPQQLSISSSSGTNAIIAPGIGAGDGALLRRQDGGAFNLYSVDMFTAGFGFPSPYNLFFETTDSLGGLSTFTVMVPGFDPMVPVPATRVNIDFASLGHGQNIVEFRWTNPAGPRQFDNFVVTKVGGMNAVPEPATWAMFIFGFGLAGAGLRRRRKVVAVA